MTTISINDVYEYKKGNISSTQTIDKMYMTIIKAKARADKLDNCIGFCVEAPKKPTESKEYLCHFKEGASTVEDYGKWHTYLAPKKKGGNAVALKSGGLQVPRKSKHARTVTNFCKEANIGEADQLDLAEFIVAARYLGTEANDDQLMSVFVDMEMTGDNEKDPKQLIKDLMAKVEEDYGLGDDGKDDDNDAEDKHEILPENPLEAFAEDNAWQGDQIDLLFKTNEEEQNLKIAINLLKTTALTALEVAEITGVDAEQLAQYEEDEMDTDYETDEEEEENDAAGDAEDKPAASDKKVEVSAPAGSASKGVVIQANTFGKSVALTKDDLGTLKQLIDGGKDEVAKRSEDSLKLLTKFNAAINMNPKGHIKRNKTLAKLKVDKVIDDEKKDKAPKLPAKYRVVIHPGALCKQEKELSSAEVCKLPIGTVCKVVEIDGRRCRISEPNQGWLSLHASDGRVILQRANVKSEMMDKAIHAERARQTKVLILKSITTLNDATVTRILEKSDWNLRRAIEAFYIAKYKTQEYLTKKEKSSKASGSKSSGSKSASSGSADKASKKKGKMAWWKSWKTFANDNP